MNAVLSCLFPCCRTRSKPDDEVPNENSRILSPPDISTSSPSYDSTSIDHTKARERLNGIVKSKEGKMVRVLSRVPFNLRNDSANEVSNTSSSRSDRSLSANISYPQDGTVEYFNDQGISRLSSRSASASSIHQASTSRLSASDDLLDGSTEHKLKVQLIPSAKSKMRILGRRGRSKTRYGRLLDDSEDQIMAPTLEGIQSVDSNRDDVHPTTGIDPAQPEATAIPDVDSKGDMPYKEPLSIEDRDIIKTLSNDISRILDDDFDDVGTLTRSWGD